MFELRTNAGISVQCTEELRKDFGDYRAVWAVENTEIAAGTGGTKKEAKNNAAALAVEVIRREIERVQAGRFQQQQHELRDAIQCAIIREGGTECTMVLRREVQINEQNLAEARQLVAQLAQVMQLGPGDMIWMRG